MSYIIYIIYNIIIQLHCLSISYIAFDLIAHFIVHFIWGFQRFALYLKTSNIGCNI